MLKLVSSVVKKEGKYVVQKYMGKIHWTIFSLFLYCEVIGLFVISILLDAYKCLTFNSSITLLQFDLTHSKVNFPRWPLQKLLNRYTCIVKFFFISYKYDVTVVSKKCVLLLYLLIIFYYI